MHAGDQRADADDQQRPAADDSPSPNLTQASQVSTRPERRSAPGRCRRRNGRGGRGSA
jgi:hypothetical protein